MPYKMKKYFESHISNTRRNGNLDQQKLVWANCFISKNTVPKQMKKYLQ
jgi:ribosomal protein L22